MSDFFEKHKGVRRLALLWACVLCTIVILRVTEGEVITNLTAAGATVVTSVIGLVGTVITFYAKKRSEDDQN